MYISNSNIGMATYLQQNQNCVKTIPNGGNVLITTTNQTQTFVLTNGATGASNVISYQQYQQLLQQQQQQAAATTHVLMPHEVVSVPTGSLVSSGGGGGISVISSSNASATGNCNNITTSTGTATQGVLLVSQAAAGGVNTTPTTPMTSFQQQFQQQIAGTKQQFQQPQQTIISTTAGSNNFLHQQQQPITAAKLTKAPTRVATVMTNQKQQSNASKAVTTATPAAKRYFSQFSQQPNASSNTLTTVSTSTAGVIASGSNNRPTHVLINRSNNKIIAANTNSTQPQKLQNAKVITTPSKPPTTLSAASTATTTNASFNKTNIANNKHNQQQQSNINSKPKTPAKRQNTGQHYGPLQQVRSAAAAAAGTAAEQHKQQQQQIQTPKTLAPSNGLFTPTSVPNGSTNKAAADPSNVAASTAATPSAAPAASSADQEGEPEVDIVINNVVCSFSVRCHLNLREIALNGFNVEFKRENGMVTMKLRRPYTTASIWSSGRITCTGATSEEQAKIAARRYSRCLQKLGFRVHFNNFRVVNVLGTCSMPWGIKIVNFSERYKKEASYEPELHPGVTYKIPHPKATLKIFSTGSMTVTAASVANVQNAIEHIFPLVYEFRKVRTPDEELLHKQQAQENSRVEMLEAEQLDMKTQPSPLKRNPPTPAVKRKCVPDSDDDYDANADDPLKLDESLDDNIVLCDTDDLIEGPDEDEDDL